MFDEGLAFPALTLQVGFQKQTNPAKECGRLKKILETSVSSMLG